MKIEKQHSSERDDVSRRRRLPSSSSSSRERRRTSTRVVMRRAAEDNADVTANDDDDDFERAYNATAQIHEDMRDATRAFHEDDRARARYWKKVKCRENRALVTFLEEYAREIEGGPSSGASARRLGVDGTTPYSMALRNASKACARSTTAVTTRMSAMALRGVGVKMVDVIERFWRRSHRPTRTEYGETLPAMRLGTFGETEENGTGRTHLGASYFDAPRASSPPVRAKTSEPRVHRARARDEDDENDASAPKRRRGAAKTKTWVPGYRTAPFALLVTMHKLALEGREVVTKRELEDEAEASGLSERGIKPKAPSRAGPSFGGARAGTHFTYSGWSCFNKQLKAVQNGYEEPMVHTWKKSTLMQIRLSETGRKLAEKLHAAAESRGDCACGFARGVEKEEDAFGARDAAADDDNKEDDDGDLVMLDEHGAWTPVPSQTAREPTTSAARPVPRPVALSNLVTPSRRGWTLPPLAPGQTYADAYDTVLIIDSSEQKMNESHIGYFRAHGVETVRMRLDAGDFAWVARPKTSSASTSVEDAYVLDYLIERKEVKDLQASFMQSKDKGNRYLRQKYRMMNYSGIKNLIYLVEGDLSSTTTAVGTYFRNGQAFQSGASGMRPKDMRKRLLSTLARTEIVDGFKVVNTVDLDGTKRLLTHATLALHATLGPLEKSKATRKARTFAEYARDFKAAQSREDSVKNTWTSMLAQVEGVGPEKAVAIADVFPTPHSLKTRFDEDANRACAAIANILTASKRVGQAASHHIQQAFFPTYAF